MRAILAFTGISWQRSVSYRNQSIDLHIKSIDWFLYDRGLRYERVKSSLGALTQPKLHINIITESFHFSQEPFNFTIIFCVQLQIIHVFSSNESGMSEMQKSSEDKESPWKIPFLILMLSDIKVSLSCVRINCVFHFFMLCLRKPSTLEDMLHSSKGLRIHSCGTLSNVSFSISSHVSFYGS